MSVIEDRLAAIEALRLDSGGHESWEKGACVMEAVAYVADERFSDHPKCASPVLTAFLIGWNDALPDDDRQQLKPFIPKLVGTNTGAEHEAVRAWMLIDWLARECAPAWLRLAGLTDQAQQLEQLVPLVSTETATQAQPVLDVAREAAREAAWDAAWAAARATAWAAAWDAAWAAARAAAWAAARDAAREAARAAARDAARDAAREAAREAARDAAWDAARDAAREAAREAAWDAARAAADKGGSWDAQYAAAKAAATPLIEQKFAPVTAGLQASALRLVDRMIEVSHTA